MTVSFSSEFVSAAKVAQPRPAPPPAFSQPAPGPANPSTAWWPQCMSYTFTLETGELLESSAECVKRGGRLAFCRGTISARSSPPPPPPPRRCVSLMFGGAHCRDETPAGEDPASKDALRPVLTYSVVLSRTGGSSPPPALAAKL